MQIYDLTHLMDPEMPVYPGKSKPCFRQIADIGKDGYREIRLEMDGHTGTHMDSPAHMFPGGKTLDQYPVSKFVDIAVVINIPEGTRWIETPFLRLFETKIERSGFVLLKTDWSRFWGKDHYVMDFPVLTEEAASWLVSHRLKGIGIDAVSVDPLESDTWPVHHILFHADCIIIENLVFPDDFDEESVDFTCLPLSIAASDGSPVRAIAIKR